MMSPQNVVVYTRTSDFFFKILYHKFMQMYDISGWIQAFPFMYDAGPRQNEVNLQGSASSALAWR